MKKVNITVEFHVFELDLVPNFCFKRDNFEFLNQICHLILILSKYFVKTIFLTNFDKNISHSLLGLFWKNLQSVTNTESATNLLQSMTKTYYKVWQMLQSLAIISLWNVTVLTEHFHFVFYYDDRYRFINSLKTSKQVKQLYASQLQAIIKLIKKYNKDKKTYVVNWRTTSLLIFDLKIISTFLGTQQQKVLIMLIKRPMWMRDLLVKVTMW